MARLVFAAAAVLVVLCHISSYGTSEAAVVAGDTYRPPIVNMQYYGGRVLTKPIRLYFVWYGTWTESQKALFRTVSNSLTPSTPISQYPNLANYWKVVTQYYQQLPNEARKYATNHVSIGGEVNDNFSRGHNISTLSDPIKIIQSHIGRDLPADYEQGVYFVFSAYDVGYTDPNPYFGYHTSNCFNGADCNNPLNNIVFSFVAVPINQLDIGNLFRPGGTLTGPPPNKLVSPSGRLDSMITAYLHELLELAVDPYPNAKGWTGDKDVLESEAADMCAYSFVAGDWWYCGLSKIYPTFSGGQDCASSRYHHSALTEPNSKATFNVYGIGGSTFIVQQFWSLGNTRGCVLQFEEAACPGTLVEWTNQKGTIQRGQFFNGIGLQRYAPGQSCSWRIAVAGAKTLNLTFDTVALGYDDNDYITLTRNNVVLKKLTRFGTNIQFTVAANAVRVNFFADGSKSPYPSSAGFIMRWEAGF